MRLDQFTQRVRFRVSLWMRSRMLPLRVRRRSLRSVLALADFAGAPILRGLDAAYICRRVHKATRRPWLMRDRQCLRTGLLGYYYLQAAGFDPVLRFAVAPESLSSGANQAHCWVSLGDQAVLSDNTGGMIEILAFPLATPAAHAVFE